jgi:putative drug exporter of the RND superfamily
VHIAGVGATSDDLQTLVGRDLTLLLASTLALIFLIVALMLRSPVAGVVVVGTVALSYASALGASVLIWQHALGHDLHWSVAPISFIALVAVGADYNLLLAMRIREEADAGLSTGIVRAFAATGGVVTTAGIVFGITMFALAGSTVLSIAQIGTTIGVGLLLDTLVVRTFVLPSLIALLGRWFRWPSWKVPRREHSNVPVRDQSAWQATTLRLRRRSPESPSARIPAAMSTRHRPVGRPRTRCCGPDPQARTTARRRPPAAGSRRRTRRVGQGRTAE